MFGNIIEILDNIVKVQNIQGVIDKNILNYHVVFEEDNRKIVGEITTVTTQYIIVFLVGEIRNNQFVSGIMKKPSLIAKCRIIYKEELELLIGLQDYNTKTNLLIGHSNTYEGYNITTNITDFFSSHFSVIGNTGSGKSCGVAKILQNIFLCNKEGMPVNSHMVLFDVYGEYNSALDCLNQLPGIGFKYYTTQKGILDDNILRIPPYFLEVDDLAILLGANDAEQLPIIENALKLAFIFTSTDPKVIEYKNDIIAKSLQDILSSGKGSTQIRDQIVAVLSKYNTETLNLNTIISQPGYDRTLRQCLNIDNQGKMNSVGLVVDFLSDFTKVDIDKIEVEKGFVYTLDDLYYAFEFALLGEGILSSEAVFDKANGLKVRLHSIINSENKEHFIYNKVITKEEYVKNFFTMPDGTGAQIVDLNFNSIDERFAKVLTKILAKLFFDYTTGLIKRGSYPIHLIVEEAHRYVQNDNDVNVLGYNIFDRITKEGRKYGTIIGFITQRPSELSKTAVSQCSNFIVFRMYYPDDLKIISSISSNVTDETIEQIKTLRPGTAIVFGTAFKIPLIVRLDLPNPMPTSTSVDIANVWYT